MSAEAQAREYSQTELDDLVASTDTGARQPESRLIARLIILVAFAWSLFQLWIASPLRFYDVFGIGFNPNDAQSRAIHLGFAVFLAFMAYPAFKRSPRRYVPLQDWLFALVGAFCASYRFWFYDALAARPGLPTEFDIAVSVVGLVLLLEATRRSLGPPLMAVAIVFLLYVFFGNVPWLPEMIQYPGASLNRAMSHLWLEDQGVFGIALGVSTKFVFLFVLFGSLLEKAGAGNYFIKVAFSLLGHLRGGPAKAAVVASGMTGLISGSSIANVVTTGTFTVPLMKRVGFSAEKAGAVEVASSVNGQIMPPVMGAAAFLMVEYVGIPYIDVIKHAFLPAVISYIALLYIVHLEALKKDMQGLPRPGEPLPAKWSLIAFGFTVSSVLIIAGAAYYALELARLLDAPAWVVLAVGAVFAVQALVFPVVKRRLAGSPAGTRIVSGGALVLCNVAIGAIGLYYGMALIRETFGGMTPWVIAAAVVGIYVGLVWYGARYPELELDDPNAPVARLPEPAPTVKSGLHFLLPIVVLVWCLMVERLSPALSAFWATSVMIAIVVTQRPLFALFRKAGRSPVEAAGAGFVDLFNGMVTGARNMIGIGIATATAGIIVGTVTLTGVGFVMANFVEFLSQGSLVLMLLLVAVLSLILGMGLPTTANYIVVSSLLVDVVVTLGAQSGLVVPAIAVHLFVFYFGIMADVTPPVGLASFAASAVSGGDPIRTGFTAFYYSLRTAALPFVFIFNTQLLLIGIEGPVELVLTVVSATIAILVFAAATQGYFIARSRFYESLLLLLVAFSLFRPGFWMDMIYPPVERVDPDRLIELAADAPPGEDLKVVVERRDWEGNVEEVTFNLDLGPRGPGEERLRNAGLDFIDIGAERVTAEPVMMGPLDNPDFDPVLEIERILVEADTPPKELVFIPALALLGGVVLLQRNRKARQAQRAAGTAAA
ncbi:MAG: TRAP transporter fused permease subunit [Alphaproteobacteria bacterium]|jgi:TRAP transporter 4TM/12TM fusion protein|nr:TRAP transporter fused permease subunit [Alphaproteobacteria bacterium]